MQDNHNFNNKKNILFSKLLNGQAKSYNKMIQANPNRNRQIK